MKKVYVIINDLDGLIQAICSSLEKLEEFLQELRVRSPSMVVEAETWNLDILGGVVDERRN